MSRRYKTLSAAIDGTEAQFQAWVVDLAQAHGWRVWHCENYRPGPSSMAGAPDLFLVHPRRGALFRELKTATGRLSQAQKDWGDDLKAAGCDYGIWRPEHKGQIRLILEGRMR